ncbi:MAG: hypothetical protein ACK4IT_00780 [Thioalkalivibrionaceae bacterium]
MAQDHVARGGSVDDGDDVAWLRQWIGLQGEVEGRRVEWIDVLEDGPAVVLLAESERWVQTSQYTRPTQRGARTFTVDARRERSEELHPVLAGLLPFGAVEDWQARQMQATTATPVREKDGS